MRPARRVAVVTTAALSLGACQSNSSADAPPGEALSVVSTDTECVVSAAGAPSGTISFSVKNEGSQVTEFYLLGEDGLRVLGEVENIGPGLTRDLVVQAAPGTYLTACKPGMVGDGIRQEFAVSDSGADLSAGSDAELVAAANTQYGSYVRDQTDQLVAGTEEFAALYTSGKDEQARALYPQARVHWERIEPVAEAFGDLDPRMDLREADLEEGQEWTGWHAIEKDLWPPADGSYTALTGAERTTIADQLVADTHELHARTRDQDFTADQIGNGAKELLDEVATGKVTGEEEIWSHTDLWDFQANVDGARVGWEGLRPILREKDPKLDAEVDRRFAELQALLDQHRDGEGFVFYDALTDAEVRALSNAVDALSEPLSKVTAAVLS